MKIQKNLQKNPNRPVLVGSAAIRYFLPEFRTPLDEDIYIEENLLPPVNTEQCRRLGALRIFINKTEIKIIREDFHCKSDKMLIEMANQEGNSIAATEIGDALVCPLELSVAMKIASCEHRNPKHKEDLQFLSSFLQIEEIYSKYSDFIDLRKKEIISRHNANRFFNHYNIPRFIEHDFLHVLVARQFFDQAPVFGQIVEQDVQVSESLFEKISHSQKIQALAEESIVLAFERNIFIQKQFSAPRLRMYARYQLLRLAGKIKTIKDHPQWLCLWTSKHLSEIDDAIERAIESHEVLSERFNHFIQPIMSGKALRLNKLS